MTEGESRAIDALVATARKGRLIERQISAYADEIAMFAGDTRPEDRRADLAHMGRGAIQATKLLLGAESERMCEHLECHLAREMHRVVPELVGAPPTLAKATPEDAVNLERERERRGRARRLPVPHTKGEVVALVPRPPGPHGPRDR